MDDASRFLSRSRDESYVKYDLSNAVYGVLPSCATDFSPRRSCASSPSRKKTIKRQRSAENTSPPSISIAPTGCWLPLPKKPDMAQHYQRLEIHQSTCLNLNMASNECSDADLWILPDFDDWELDTTSAQQKVSTTHENSEWAPFLRRAANSNLERLRTRLEGDGWAFVGGKYEENKKVLQEEASLSEESVDDEFDVVVLPAVGIS